MKFNKRPREAYTLASAENKIKEIKKFLKTIELLRTPNKKAASSNEEYNSLATLKETKEYEKLKNDFQNSKIESWPNFLSIEATDLIEEVKNIVVSIEEIEKTYKDDYLPGRKEPKSLEEYKAAIAKEISSKRNKVVSSFSGVGEYIEGADDMNMDLERIISYKNSIIDFLLKLIPSDSFGPITKFELYFNEGKRSDSEISREFIEDQLPSLLTELESKPLLRKIIESNCKTDILEEKWFKEEENNNLICSMIKSTQNIYVDPENIKNGLKKIIADEKEKGVQPSIPSELLRLLGINLEPNQDSLTDVVFKKIVNLFKPKLETRSKGNFKSL